MRPVKYCFNLNIFFLFLIFFIPIVIAGCKKFLEERPDKSLVIPRDIKELQGILDQDVPYISYPRAIEYSNDDLYFTSDGYNSYSIIAVKDAHIWKSDAELTTEWSGSYNRIYNANVVLEAIDKMSNKGTQDEYNNVKGSALFYRAYNFYTLAQVFSPQYTAAISSTGLGIPLKTSPNIDDETVRSTVQETYDKIIADCKESIPLLPSTIIYKTRPSKASVFALLARTYLVTGDYMSAGKYADSCLQLYNSLIDYNTLPLSSTPPLCSL